MDQESITKGILNGIVDRYLVEIAGDPNRSIRKLLDLAERTSDGPTQKICYQMMQQMAADQNSPYYEMIHHLVTHVDPKTIKQFGINLGHNAWTFGSGYIRKIVASSDASISWAILIDRANVPGRIPFSEISDMICRGRENKVFAWLLMPSKDIDEWEIYTELFRTHPDSVFALTVNPSAVNEEFLDEASDIHNLMLLLNTEKPDWQSAAEELSRRGFLYSVWRWIRNVEDAADVTSGSWFEEISPYHPLMGWTFVTDDCPAATAAGISDHMWQTRLNQLYPVLPVDLVSDFLVINRLVSHEEVLYRVNPDGSVSSGKKDRFELSALNIHDLFAN